VTASDRTNLRARFLAVLAQAPAGSDSPHLLCVACLTVLAAQRVAITINSTDGTREFLSASDEIAEQMEWTQITLGDGPRADASLIGPVLVYDAAGTSTPWPLFAQEAELAGIGSLYALPLQLGSIRVGALSLYLEPTQRFSASDLEDAIAIADLVTSILLSAGATDSLHPLDSWWDQPEAVREIHQATGMVVAQLGVNARDAYVRLRAYSFARGLPLGNVARDVVHRGLRIDTEPEPVV
jgi:ANTAR domain